MESEIVSDIQGEMRSETRSQARTGESVSVWGAIQYGLFWSWNLIFLAFMSLGFAPILLPDLFVSVQTGVLPVAYLLYALLLSLVPVVTVILGLTVLRRSPQRLFALGYVVEGPLMLVLAVRFFLIRQATPGVTAMLLFALAGMGVFLWTLLDRHSWRRHPLVEFLRLAGLALMAIISLYAAAWIAFYAVPLGVEGLRGLANLLSNLPSELRGFWRGLVLTSETRPLMLPFSILGMILILYTGTLFVLTPLTVPFLSLRAWWRGLRALARRSTSERPAAWGLPALLSVLVLVLSVGLFFLVNRQPQRKAFALLAQPPGSEAQAFELLNQSEAIRAGLLNAYLAPFRYISAEGEVVHVSRMYASTFHLPDAKAYRVERLYESLASPLLYKPVHLQSLETRRDNHALSSEPQEAARLYQRFFDAPIAQAERPTIVRAVRSTWSQEQAEAAWQAVDDREVHLVSQELTLQEHGDWAEVELHEAYQNQTADQQEVIYYFNLPESAVLTGLWLGGSPDKQLAQRFQVAPRGAAQAVYREQTRVARDPALLEQVGPRQYRLRVYPIPPLLIHYDADGTNRMIEEGQPLYMWVAWRQMRGEDGWPMPQMALLRNVYWDEATTRLVNGQPVTLEADQWLPSNVAASEPYAPQVHRVDLPDGQTVLAIPEGVQPLSKLPAGLRLAIVLDRSRSMDAYASQVAQALQQLQGLDLQAADVYLTASPYRGEAPSVVSLDGLQPDTIVYYGGQNAGQLLAQFAELQEGRAYDAALVLTDGTGYELGENGVSLLSQPFPIWLVHLGGAIPIGYDDQTLQAVQASGGGVAGSLDEALSRLAVALQAGPGAADLVDGYRWMVLPTREAQTELPDGAELQVHGSQDPFAALAARRVVLAEIQRQRGVIDQVSTLDDLHALAKQYEIVTPYSSMIVLVDVQQQRLLNRLTFREDRYQREVEDMGDTTPGSPVPLTGVPEPQEWLLLAIIAALLLYMGYQRREAQRMVGGS